jgi:hypothetical protein
MKTTLMVLLSGLFLCGCSQKQTPPTSPSHYPTEAEKRKDYGDSFIYQGAPFRCIYVGLDTNEMALFDTNFWRFAAQHDIHRPKKDYQIYSGPPLATCKSDHVSVFEDVTPTAHIVEQHDRHADSMNQDHVSWQGAFWMEEYWPTNACRIMKDGREILAPLSGVVKIAPNDTNYPLQDFKRLSEALTASLQSAFPDRTVRVFSYDGDKQ